MTTGAHSVEVTVQGPEGEGRALVPFESIRREILEMERGVAAMLVGMGLFLFVGAVTILAVSVRESTLAPGENADARRRWRGAVAAAVATILFAAMLWFGWYWWSDIDAAYRLAIFEPMPTTATVETIAGAAVLDLAITDQRWIDGGWSPLIPDHGKLMHMFLVRDDLGAFAHVHPVPADDSSFRLRMPPLPEGNYRLYADIVHESGFSQTLVNQIELLSPAAEVAEPGATPVPGELPAVDPDDSWTVGLHSGDAVLFDDGTEVEWVRPAGPIVVGDDLTLEFQVRDGTGQPVALEPYMGMLSHSAITREDGAVFVHLHPTGSISMGALMVASERLNVATDHMAPRVPGRVAFPYAFPRAGTYRVWVQVKNEGRVYTADFEMTVQ